MSLGRSERGALARRRMGRRDSLIAESDRFALGAVIVPPPTHLIAKSTGFSKALRIEIIDSD